MRIYDETNKRSLVSMLIMLTPSEVHQLKDLLESLNLQNDHFHINDKDFKREITIGLYTPENIHHFHPDVIRLLQEDE